MTRPRHYSTSSSDGPDDDFDEMWRRAGLRVKKYWNRTYSLKDGRGQVGYAIFVAEKNFKHTVVFFHGTPGSRIEARTLGDAAEKLRIRLLAFDRPEYGLSTDRRLPNIGGFAKIIKEVLQNVFHDPSVYLFGYSNGAAYALATAAMLGKSRVEGVCLVAGFPPWDLAKQEIPLSTRRLIQRAKLMPTWLAPSAGLSKRVRKYMPYCDVTAQAVRPKAIL